MNVKITGAAPQSAGLSRRQSRSDLETLRVSNLQTGKVETVSASYGMRLIEQGKAVLAPKPAKKPDKKEAPGAAPQSAGLSRRQSQSDLETQGVSNLKAGDA